MRKRKDMIPKRGPLVPLRKDAKSTKSAKTGKQDKPEAALSDIQTEEISLVPAGANRWPLLVVKGKKDSKNKKTRKMAVPYKELPVASEDTSWDGDAARKRVAEWASSDGSGEKEKIDFDKYKDAFLYMDEAAPSELMSYKMPVCDVIDGELKVVWNAVVAAYAAVQGARGGVEIPEEDIGKILERLEMHYQQFGKEFPEQEEIAETTEVEQDKEDPVVPPASNAPAQEQPSTPAAQEAPSTGNAQQTIEVNPVHPKFKKDVLAQAKLLLDYVQRFMGLIEQLPVLESIPVEDLEAAYWQWDYVSCELPPVIAAEIQAALSIMYDLQSSIPWSMRLAKMAMDPKTLGPDPILKILGVESVEKITQSQRTLISGAVSLLNEVATSGTQPAATTATGTDKTQDEMLSEIYNLLQQMGGTTDTTKNAKNRTAHTKPTSSSKKSGSIPPAQGSTPEPPKSINAAQESEVAWPLDMNAYRKK